MSHFDHASEWDPGVERATLLTPQAVGRCSRFHVVAPVFALFFRISVPLEYEIVEFDPPERVIVRAETALLRSTDTISLLADGAGTVVDYDARLEARGLRRVGDPVLGVFLRRIGDRAAAGLHARLNPIPSP